MNLRRLQSLALIVGAVLLLPGVTGAEAGILGAISAVSIVLFMMGIPAVIVAQPSGRAGWIGIVLLEVGALIALAFRLGLVPHSSLGDSLSLTSAILGMLGAVIIGWLTARGNVFPAWAGWLFLTQGVLNFLAGVLDLGSMGGALPFVLELLLALALLAYGYFIYGSEPKTGS